ncbi:MAG: FkbM family methyltransferase [Acidobacteria bacterium]|nr:FkbM family methyltransferase [Acidobacteriota bacterium]
MIAADSHAPQRTLLVRLGHFLQKPWSGKFEILGFHARQVFQGLPVPVRLPFGSWWLAGRDTLGSALLAGGFENAECRFVQEFLRPGMIVLDIGAHHGLYTLLASKCVGPHGRVYAFEPSPRERRKLTLHLHLNLCRNVQLREFALAEHAGETEFFLVEGKETGCNSLRLPAVHEPTKVLRVRVSRLDDFLQREHVERVDFIKMDVEGAELAVLKGAGRLLEHEPRPVILAEVYDIRTEPWGYPARDIVAFLHQRAYLWFRICGQGDLQPVEADRKRFDDNFVAVPEERLDEIRHLMPANKNEPCPLSE